MNLILAQQLTKGFSETPLFSNINFSIQAYTKIALFGRNGKGKTTLLKLIAQIEPPDKGTIEANNDLQIIYVEQNKAFDLDKNVIDNILNMNNERIQVFKAYQDALNKNDAALMPQLLTQMDELHIWDIETEIKKIMTKLDILPLYHSSLKNLSGGQLKRIVLTKSLLEMYVSSTTYQLLLMDEPTNHLDIEMIDWLEKYLTNTTASIMMVTHDRRFLDAVCDEIWNLENGHLRTYKGNYEYFITQKSQEEAAEKSTIAKAQNMYVKELEWIRKQPKARTTKSKSRIDNFYIVEQQAKRKVEKEYVQLHMNTTRLGSKIVELKQVCKNFGERKILDHFTYTFNKGDKIGLVGKNGIGKTTMLNIIQHKEPIDAGTVKIGDTVKFGYYQQKGLPLDKDYRVIEYVKSIAEYFSLTKGETISASHFLEMFLFSREKQYTYVSSLSGGEQRKLQLLTTLFEQPNFLVLDEPTNDLDIDSLMVLEKFLIDFTGCILMVSHDRFFMDKIVNHLFVMKEDEQVKVFPGNYNEYIIQLEAEKIREKASLENLQPTTTTAPTKLSYKVSYELQQLEKDIEKLEKEKQTMLQLLEQQTNEVSHEKISKLGEDIQHIMNRLQQKEDRWLELQG